MSSLFGALNIGVSGLNAQGNALGVISDNISNSNTVGYKEGLPSFAELVSSFPVTEENPKGETNTPGGVTNSSYIPDGVTSSTISLNNVQGDIVAGTSSTNIAISGQGFFPVSQHAGSGGAALYTRQGSFTADANGNLVNTAGYYLQGFPINADGTTPDAVNGSTVASSTALGDLQTVNVANLSEKAIPTSTASIAANLTSTQAPYSGTPAYNPSSNAANMASGSVQPQFDTPVTVIDSTGASHTLEAGFLKTADNSWAMEVYGQPTSDVTSGNSGQVAAGTVTFNGDGSLASVSPSLTQFNVSWQNGASNSIALDLGTAGPQSSSSGTAAAASTNGLTQTASQYSLQDVQQNGVQAGSLTNVAVTASGYVTASYSNGSSRNLYKVPLATFPSPDQLQSISGDVFTQSKDSGTPTFSTAGQNGAGTIQGSSLESSNVDVATQLSNLILAQNSYQFNSKLITTTDTMLQDLTQMDQSISV